MKSIYLIVFLFAPFLAIAQNNEGFRAALVSEIRALHEGEEIIVEYNKTGDWGAYEGGFMSLKLTGETVHTTLTNTNQYNKQGETSTTARSRSDLIALLNNAVDTIEDEDNFAINNYIHYNIKKNGQSIFSATSNLTPSQIINKVKLNPAFSEFLKPGKQKQAGILINNIQ